MEVSQAELDEGIELAAAPGIPAPTRKQHVIYGICCSPKFKMFTALLMFYPPWNKEKNFQQQSVELWVTL